MRALRDGDIDGIIELSRAVYSGSPPWSRLQLESHQRVFPEGQLVAVDEQGGRVLGVAASLIVQWDDYSTYAGWHVFTAGGYFTNHDPRNGRTLYGAEVMVHPEAQGQGVGKLLYAARRELSTRLNLTRIRAGARLRGYHRYAGQMSARDYTLQVIARKLGDPTLSFQLKQGFRVIAVVEGYLRHDPESLGWAAVIEWINHRVAQRRDYRQRPALYGRHRRATDQVPVPPKKGPPPRMDSPRAAEPAPEREERDGND